MWGPPQGTAAAALPPSSGADLGILPHRVVGQALSSQCTHQLLPFSPSQPPQSPSPESLCHSALCLRGPALEPRPPPRPQQSWNQTTVSLGSAAERWASQSLRIIHTHNHPWCRASSHLVLPVTVIQATRLLPGTSDLLLSAHGFLHPGPPGL